MECDIASYHVNSYNYFADHGVNAAAVDVPAEKWKLPNGDCIEVYYTGASLGKPVAVESVVAHSYSFAKVMPSECRMRGISYSGILSVNLSIRLNGRRLDSFDVNIGMIPVMLCSNRCHLNGKNKSQLMKAGEEPLEKGGYFIVNGSEKVVRLLIGNRRNYPLAIKRKGLRDKGEMFSEYAIMLRCIKENHSASILNIHYLESSNMCLSIQYRQEIFYVPFIYVMKALVPYSDREIFEILMRGREEDNFWRGCVSNMISSCQDSGVLTQEQALLAIGARFRIVLGFKVGEWESDKAVARTLFKYCLCIHLEKDEEKFELLAYSAQKLIALVKKEIVPESLDNPQFQEATTSGQVVCLVLREKLENTLTALRIGLNKHFEKNSASALTLSVIQRYLPNVKTGLISNGLSYLLATGNIITRNGLGIQQTSGMAVIAERINQLRFVSHFRAIHRGSFFMEMRTTDVRKLRPEAWGFICPVHTPDGGPCGLLNHLTASCDVTTHYHNIKKLRNHLRELSVISHSDMSLLGEKSSYYPVLLDGIFMGFIEKALAPIIERKLREIKVNKEDDRVPYNSEITLVRSSTDPQNIATQYPGLYIFTEPARMIRPVKNLLWNEIEFVGTFEQVYMSIVIKPEEEEDGVTMHQELHPSSLFSFAGNLIPFPDHNQSPRNVYQCQMGKQTMGTAVHAWRYRADGKMYRLMFPQSPLMKTEAYDKYEMDEYPLGTNAIIAVISYTGYDMEDAMVINKSSFERGYGHGCVVKVERVDLSDGDDRNVGVKYFAKDPNFNCKSIDSDGLPVIGRIYKSGEVFISYYDTNTGKYCTMKTHNPEPYNCISVRLVKDINGRSNCHALIEWRVPRNPIIGDKFASRHGQKGINSFLWPAESLPFSESGMVPDVIFNPHGYPSRMTIGMMIETMAGKAAACHGEYYDASPFVFNEKHTAIDHFGQYLEKAGFNYYGNEVLYSGVDGREMEVQIFMGIVYYQRLRHMVSDKFQVRSTGPIDPIHHQPIKGRKVGGGIRFGEMERDALIAHGSSFCLQDRLFNCSDRDLSFACSNCMNIFSVVSTRDNFKVSRVDKNNGAINLGMKKICYICKKSDDVYPIQLPRVFKYLVAELASMNIKVDMGFGRPDDYKN
uniref:DNA-directed RNA polymerase subunit beta n=1 Tax=Strongyloides venezuelensis TaxID=75913 RepID=A0A0K0EYJ3_STRVS